MAEHRAIAGAAGKHRLLVRIMGEHHHHAARLGQSLGKVSSVIADPVRCPAGDGDDALHRRLARTLNVWQRTDGRPRRISRPVSAMVFSTRRPSRTARRLLPPCTRSYSQLGTSTIAKPAVATVIIIRVSTSKPFTSTSTNCRQSRQKAL